MWCQGNCENKSSILETSLRWAQTMLFYLHQPRIGLQLVALCTVDIAGETNEHEIVSSQWSFSLVEAIIETPLINQSNPTDSSNSLMRFQRDLKMVLHSIALLMFCYHTKKSNILHDTTSISLFLPRSQQQDHRNALSHSASREMAFLDETQRRQLPLSSSRSNC